MIRCIEWMLRYRIHWVRGAVGVDRPDGQVVVKGIEPAVQAGSHQRVVVVDQDACAVKRFSRGLAMGPAGGVGLIWTMARFMAVTRH